MQWMNEPPSWKIDGDRIEVTAAGGSDFWRKTHYGFIRDSGHFGYETIKGDCTLDVKITGGYHELYDQAGLMLRVNNEHWIKTGIEYVHEVQNVSAVVTNDFSDWSVVPLPQNPPSIWMRVTRKVEAVEVFYSLDGANYTMLRMAYLLPSDKLEAGIMCAAPDGKGFPVVFEGLAIRLL
jgi:regulation of enolase protein 1 (concanavalin A-like superfamily)